MINIIMTRKIKSNTTRCFSLNLIFLCAVCEYGIKCFAHDSVKRWDAYMNKYFEVSATYAQYFIGGIKFVCGYAVLGLFYVR